ncbi:hypothetical protein MJG53_015675 [Ovis ammon polii x Ovis aries]|uniref:Uncharacterized protein n=1 Tax=Ovis ammon polii x Ovis aries TaxID=2918886 RepID=A0ACB9UG29_9CETA|nr:hypothetical protein MJG53_015675 [Ovis ammon polii x Ovis aries]
MAIHRAVLTCLGLPLFLLPGARAQEQAPPGCSPDLNPLYYNLCDRSEAWGIILEAVAGAGVVTTFVLTIILVASLPFVQDTKKRSLLGTQVFFLLGTLGLFCLVFACVVKPDFSTCASRRFLFGVLFAICFSCLVAHVLALHFLVRKNHGPRGWVIFLVALLLSLVEVIINTEWLIITLVRGAGAEGDAPGNGSAGWVAVSPCAIANADFVMALIYVMLLLLCAFTGAWSALCGRFKRWRKHGVFVLLTTTASIAVWVVWTVMYTYGNRQHNSPTWDDPTLAIALATNAWAFVLFYVIPEVSQVTRSSPEQSYQGDLYPTRGVGYETILKEQKGQSMFVENKAFSMDEPASAKRPVSPYSGYNGQLLTSMYQPTEMTLMHKAPSDGAGAYDVILPRATANSQVTGSANSTLRAEDIYTAHSRQEATLPKEGKSSQVPGKPLLSSPSMRRRSRRFPPGNGSSAEPGVKSQSQTILGLDGVLGLSDQCSSLPLPLTGCLSLSGPSRVTGIVGRSLSVECRYQKKFISNNKYWCKPFCLLSPKIVETTESQREVTRGRVSIRDHPANLTFTVTLKSLREEDAGTYECGINVPVSIDPTFEVEVSVIPAKVSTVSFTTLTTESATHSASSQEEYEPTQNWRLHALLISLALLLLLLGGFSLLAWRMVQRWAKAGEKPELPQSRSQAAEQTEPSYANLELQTWPLSGKPVQPTRAEVEYSTVGPSSDDLHYTSIVFDSRSQDSKANRIPSETPVYSVVKKT